MSGGGWHYVTEIYWLGYKLLERVRWLTVFARNELPDITRKVLPWCLILNTHLIDQPCTHWISLNVLKAGLIELFFIWLVTNQ